MAIFHTCWADPVVHILLLKSSMASLSFFPLSTVTRFTTLAKFEVSRAIFKALVSIWQNFKPNLTKNVNYWVHYHSC